MHWTLSAETSLTIYTFPYAELISHRGDYKGHNFFFAEVIQHGMKYRDQGHDIVLHYVNNIHAIKHLNATDFTDDLKLGH
jgi:hypothetical protein